jgi:ribosomal protein L18E
MLIAQLRKVSSYKALARDLGRPRRQKAELSLDDLDKAEADKVATAAKIITNGKLERSVTVYAWRVSKSAAEKIKAAGGAVYGLGDLLKTKDNVKII